VELGSPLRRLQLTPFRGKLAIFEKAFVDTDAYFHAGRGVQRDLRSAGELRRRQQRPRVHYASSFQLASRVAIAPTFGIGLHFFMAGFMSLGVEYRAVPFAWNPRRVRPKAAGGGNNGNFPDYKITTRRRTFKFNQMITIELGFGLPPKPKISE